jgi:hypothetical protein
MIADVMLVVSVIAFAVAVKEIHYYFKEVGK